MKVICTNSDGIPNEIPKNKHVVKGETYTVIETCKCNAQGGIYGFKLEEIDLSDCQPYNYFAAYRFELDVSEITEIKEELVELA